MANWKREMKNYFSILIAVALFTACAHVSLKESAPSISWGSRGSSPGKFNEPFAIAVDASGKVYVADARNHRIQKFSDDGKFLTQWGGQGDEPGKFERPSGLAVDRDGNIFVSDYELDRIQKFTSEGKFLMQWGSSGKNAGQFNSPTGLAIDSNIYVTDTYNHRVQKFDLQGNFIKEWGEYQVVSIVKSFLNFFVSAESNFNYPTRITIGLGSTLYVSDAYNNRVQKFSSDGVFISQFGGLGFLGGSFRVASGIANDKKGNLYVADFYNHRVQKFTKEGSFLNQWGGKGQGAGQFEGPTDVAVGPQGQVYVVDWGNHRIQIFNVKRN
ncbi:MAG: DNA-binding beta-propeller fold protein YncE [Nitrospinales bacterium]|jgi:DNA-binding beta-propeller fold protein YncE